MEFLSGEWVARWIAVSNADPEFVAAGRGFDGVAVAVIDPDQARAGDRRILRLAGSNGIWTRAQVGTGEDLARDALFTLTAPYLAWKLG